MAWTVKAEELLADRIYQPIKFHRNLSLRAIKTQVVIYNNPSFTNILMELYSSKNKTLIKQSSSLTKAQVHTLSNAIAEIYFEFDDISVKDLETYYVSLLVSGYSGTSTSHIAWVRSFPDPIYTTNVTVNETAPMKLGVIGCELL